MKEIDGVRYPTVNQHAILGFFQEYRWLSNFHMCSVEIDNIVYPSSEHAYMAQKTNDIELKERIAELKTPKEAKEFGRTLMLMNVRKRLREEE